MKMSHPEPYGFELPVTARSRRQQLIDHSTPSRAEGISPASLLLQGIMAELLLEEAAWVGGEGREAGFGPQGSCPPMPAAGS